jgi:hypothetical protein
MSHTAEVLNWAVATPEVAACTAAGAVCAWAAGPAKFRSAKKGKARRNFIIKRRKYLGDDSLNKIAAEKIDNELENASR